MRIRMPCPSTHRALRWPSVMMPFFGDLFSEGDVLFLGGGAMLLATNRRGALPEAAIAAPVKLDFPVHQFVIRHDETHQFSMN